MDTFFEQIVPVKKSGADLAKIFGIWILALILSFFIFLLSAKYLGFIFGLTLAGLIYYGAYRLSKLFFIEYEYIITNGTLDIDKIIAKSSRKRVLSVDIPNISSIEKFNPNQKLPNNAEKTLIACSSTDENQFLLSASRAEKGSKTFVIAPDDRIKEGIIKSLPKFIANSAFK